MSEIFSYLGIVLAFVGIYLVWRSRYHANKRNWKLMPYGGGSPILLKDRTEEEATTFCSDHHGSVKYVDQQYALIFYKPRI